jgi:hypothetical protein
VAARTEFSEDKHRVRTEPNRRAHAGTQTRVAEVLAFIGLVAALIGALGPAERIRSTYSWPPETLPAGTPSRLWYTPLLLAARIPEGVVATVPCSTPRPLPNAARPVTVLATARSPERNGGLSITRDDGQLTVGVGEQDLARVPLSRPTSDAECMYRLFVANRRWSITGGPNQVDLRGDLGQMPVVNGLFSTLDLRSGIPPSIRVTTKVHVSRPTVRQKVAWTIAALCLVVALILVAARSTSTRPWAAATGVARTVMSHARAVDAVVGLVLLGWWVISPAFWDDGWTIARQSAFVTSGGFSNYYDSFGASLPLGYWLEWAQHWLTQSTSTLIILRVPAVLCLAATWVLCRWILARLVSAGRESSVVLWTLAASFAVAAMAWGMTLRQEPVVAVLVTGVMACTIRFLERKTVAPLAVGAVLVPLAITAHPAGVLSIAPLIVIAPTLFGWARTRSAAAATILTSAAGLLIVLAFIGSDVVQRSVDAQTVSWYSTTVRSWRDEIFRYDLLSGTITTSRLDGFGTPLRRASVALIALAVLAFMLRRPRGERTLLDLPAASLAVALVLLIGTPSKWPWHFGSLVGLVCLAVASETARLHYAAQRSSRWHAQPFIAIGAATLTIAWSWSPHRPVWNALDLRTLEWNIPPMTLVIVLPLVLLGCLFVLLARDQNRRYEAPWQVAVWTTPVLAVVIIAFTAGVLIVDTAKTSSWTLTRQHMESLSGDAGCGLADDLLVPVAASARPLSSIGDGGARPEPSWVPSAPVADLARFALGPAGDGSATSPWFKLPVEQRIGLFVAGLPGTSDTLALEWGRLHRGRVESLGTTEIPLVSRAETESTLVWRFVSSGELPRVSRTNAVRVTLRSDAPPGSAIAVTAPVVYKSEPLTRRIDGNRSRSLVIPNVRMYFPCVQLPRLSGGIVEVPWNTVSTSDSFSPVEYPGSSPFSGLLDLYRLERLPVADSENPPADLVVFGVDRRIPGAHLAPPVRATLKS